MRIFEFFSLRIGKAPAESSHGKKTRVNLVREARTRIREISGEEFDEMIETHDGPLIVDARETEEFLRGHFHRCAVLLRSTSSPGVNLDNRRSPARRDRSPEGAGFSFYQTLNHLGRKQYRVLAFFAPVL
ncbi:MAG: hypothetical protein HY082_00500 [Gammaproteobacteria bacterium]|nr:hypothetical protein [Gammaproteobacteria bacterium]